MLDNPQKLSKMSNEELWALFPIVIREYNPDYPIWYAEEELVLAELIGNDQIERISHIGSTAVPGLLSKPTVDILLEITQNCNVGGLVFILEQNGYICSKQPESPSPHLMFMKGYTLQGFAEKVFHLHVRYGGDWDELYFRDYLRLHPDISQQYGILKSEIQQRLEHDRDGYTYAKTDFIKRYTQLAKSELGVMLNSKNNKCIKMIQLREISQTRPEEIQRLANNHAIAVNLRDTFPYPYTLEDAVTYLDLVVKGELGHVFGIYKDDTFVGCCSVIPQYDIYRINAEIGYWIGEPYWGKGYATEAVKLSVEYAFKELDLLRVYAYIFEYNTASMRVLEKASFEKEAIIKSSIIKEGKVFDEHLYSIRRI